MTPGSLAWPALSKPAPPPASGTRPRSCVHSNLLNTELYISSSSSRRGEAERWEVHNARHNDFPPITIRVVPTLSSGWWPLFTCCLVRLLIMHLCSLLVRDYLEKCLWGHVWYWNYIWLQNMIHPAQVGSIFALIHSVFHCLVYMSLVSWNLLVFCLLLHVCQCLCFKSWNWPAGSL